MERGIGKSTAVSNLAAAMAQAGKRVAVVGCDPKADSTRGLMGRRIPTVLDQLKTGRLREIAFTGQPGCPLALSRRAEPGTGCAGRGIIVAMERSAAAALLTTGMWCSTTCWGRGLRRVQHAAAGAGGRRGVSRHHQRLHGLYAANNICRVSANTPIAVESDWRNSSTATRGSVDNDSLLKPLRRSWEPRWRGKFP